MIKTTVSTAAAPENPTPARYAPAPHPLPRNPIGWYAVELSSELAPGEVKEVHAVGRELVLFRTDKGEAGLIDAFCPHLGAHFAYGGEVDGDCIRCPFHRWGFSPDGACVDIPYAKKIPTAARVGAYEVRERNGAILAWFHPENAPPTFEIPDFATEGWSEPRWDDLIYEMHIQEAAENAVDIAHFTPVHNCARSTVEIIDAKGHPFHHILRTAYDGDGIGVPGQYVNVSSDWEMHGLSMFHIITTADDFGTRVRHLFHFTPVPGDILHTRVATSVDTSTVPADMVDLVLKKNAEINKRNFEEDKPIWANKRYLDRPVFSSSDGPLSRVRRWSRQFYPAALRRLEMAAQAPVVQGAAASSAQQEIVEPDDDQAHYEMEVTPEVTKKPAASASKGATPGPLDVEVSPTAVRRIFEEEIPRQFQPDAVERPFVVQYEISGDAGGVWHINVAPGACECVEGEHPGPEVTLRMADADWIALQIGKLDRMSAFTSGRLTLAGDLELAAALGNVFSMEAR